MPHDLSFVSVVRHGWVWLNDDWAGELRLPLAPADHALLADWQGHGRPLVVARVQPGDGHDVLRFGLATPTKRRIAVVVGPGAVASVRGPLPLAEAQSAAPPAWRDTLSAVAAAVAAVDIRPYVFGSLAWQQRSGLAYVHSESDVDLLFTPARWSQVLDLLSALSDIAGRQDRPRLDGEIVLPDGGAVAWRELAQRPAAVLVKGPGGVALRPFAGLETLFAEVVDHQEHAA